MNPSEHDTSLAVVVRDLRKQFGANVAVDGLSLDVLRGSFFGLVGPNGAGKSTTLKAVTGLLRPDSGRVGVDGRDVWADPTGIKARIGILPDSPKLFDRLTGRELLTYNGLLRGMNPELVDARASELLSVLGLEEAGDTMVVDYSTGMVKKTALACALVHGPRVLFLDEPLESVDPVSARTIVAVLQAFTSRGGTVVLSSHVMDTVQRLCDHVAIVHRGRIVKAGAVDEVRQGRSLEEAFIETVGAAAATESALSWLGRSSG
jgi:ABC-2 type transport system ATP-binding protein